MAKNFGVAPVLFGVVGLTASMILALSIAIPILLFGLSSVIRFIGFMFSPAASGGIPVWAIFVIGIISIIIIRRFRRF